MNIRINRVKRPNKTYEYVELVQAYRRKRDGKPAVRVIANLGRVGTVDVDNLRLALEASRQGKQVVVQEARPEPSELLQPLANLQYLDVAVLLETWKEWGLTDLINELLPAGAADVRPADVVTALAVHRCAGPQRELGRGSKVGAATWFDDTALPELLQVSPATFNNSRLHRVLEQLEQATPALMEALPRKYVDQEAAFTALFADITDAVFVGQGPELAAKGRTKAGQIRRKIGIALLCNQHGYPIRWKVVAGNAAEQPVLAELYEAVAGKSWAYHVPVICDRAMGASANICKLSRTGLRFLTALRKPEFSTYAENIAWGRFEGLSWEGGAAVVKAAGEAAEAAGFERVDDTLFVLDMGILEPAQASPKLPTTSDDRCRTALQYARAIEEAVEARHANSYNAAARQLGLTTSMGKKYRKLLQLSLEIQQRVLAGEAQQLSLTSLFSLRSLDPEAQRERFEALRAAGTRPGPQGKRPRLPDGPRVRVVAYFNPELFVEQRKGILLRRQAIQAWVVALNDRLKSPRSKMTRDKTVAAIDRRLRKDQLLNAYEIQIDRDPTDTRFLVTLRPIERAFARRSCHAGFTVLVGHPGLQQPAAELARLYRAKDSAIEKSFRTIKSIVTLEPVRHQTDHKVQAHVTICMLALLLERTLRAKLEGKRSAPAALAALRPCRLNYYEPPLPGLPPRYRRNHASPEQIELLKALQLEHLLDEEHLACKIHPR
jgi:hypothetical protein